MISITEAYKQSSEERERKSYVEWEFGGWDEVIKGLMLKGQLSTNGSQSFCIYQRVLYDIEIENDYITCEPNAHKLSDNLCFLKNKMSDEQPIAYWSKKLSLEKKTFDTNPYFSMKYYGSRYTRITNIMLEFEQVCSDFNIRWYKNTDKVYSQRITNNKELQCYIIIPEEYRQEIFNSIMIEFEKTKEPYRFIKLKSINFGEKQYFSSEDILSFELIEETSFNTSERFHNSLSLSLNNKEKKWDIFNPDNKISEITKMQEISGYHYLKVGKQYKKIPLGKFYIDEVKNYENKLELNAYDKSYFITSEYYGSLFYENKTAYNIFTDFFNYYNFTSYKLNEKLKKIYLTGYVEPLGFNDALRSIAEACCCIIKNNRYGNIEIKLANDYLKYTIKNDPTIYNKITKTYKSQIVNSANNTNNIYENINVNIYQYYIKDGDTSKREEIYNSEYSLIGAYVLTYSKYPIRTETIGLKVYNENNNVIQEIKEDGTVVGNGNVVISLKKYTTSCIIEIGQIIGNKIKIIITGLPIEKEYFTNVYSESEEAELVDNTLITQNSSSEEGLLDVGHWKNDRRQVKYNFSTLLAPYVEVGDLCKYRTDYKEEKEFTPTKITISNSIQETIEGE